MHQPLSGLRGQASDIAIQAEQLAFTKRRMAELTAQHSGQKVEQIQADSNAIAGSQPRVRETTACRQGDHQAWRNALTLQRKLTESR